MHKLTRELGALEPFDTRNFLERRYVLNTFCRPFSAYLGGIHQPGYWVERLGAEWSSTFRCQHSIPCNSATSGLLAACMAVGIGPGDIVWAPVYTMSATAACAKVLGADVRFIDIEPNYFSMNPVNSSGKPKAVIVTNLFGHPAMLNEIREWCDTNNVWMIEDNAQSPFAEFLSQYTGTIGHLGVFSLNIHKHMQTGEGGVVVTNDGDLALKVKDAINHGELRYGGITGLNLRMTEPIAAMACAQLSKGHWIVEQRRELALDMTDMVKDYSQLHPPKEMTGCKHVYYIWACKVWSWDRDLFTKRLFTLGLPMVPGYSPLLSDVFETKGYFPVAENLEQKELITFDICSYSPTRKQRKIMREIFKIVAENFK